MIYFLALNTRILQGRGPSGNLRSIPAIAILEGPFTTYEAAHAVLDAGGWPRKAFVKGYEMPEALVDIQRETARGLMARFFGGGK